MRRLLNTTMISVLALALPAAALANLTGTPTLSNNITLNLDTGATGFTGGDILWNGALMTPQGNATAFNLGTQVASQFGTLTQAQVSAYQYSKISIIASLNDIFAIHTNGGNYAAVQVTALSQSSITLQFVTYGASAVSTGPSITQVLNNYGLIPAGFPNSGIAQGSLFVIKGTGLASPGALATPLQSSTTGKLPTGLNGATVSIKASDGSVVTPVFYYATNSQLALVLPSSTPLGAATVTTTYSGQTSAAFPFQVVANAMGFGTYYGSGSGLGLAVNATSGLLYTFASPIPPGATIELYGSGLGADAARDNQYADAPFAINSLAHIYIGGVDAPIYYQGASGFPGLNQVNVTIPINVPNGCNIPVTGVTASGVPTNTITLPISNGPCSDPAFGVTGAELQTLSGLPNVRTGFVALSQTTSPASSSGPAQVVNAASATFQQFTAAAYSAASYSTASGSLSLGGCIVNQYGGSTSVIPTTTPLGAGTITLTGPVGGLQTLTSSSAGIYNGTLPTGFIPAAGGAFTLSGGGGTSAGLNIGNFSAQISFSSPLMTWTNQNAATTVNRAAGLPVSWSGGGVNSFVLIYGVSSTSGGPQGLSGSFSCYVPTSAGQFTVPGYVTSALPAGTGSVFVQNYTNFQPFTASGLDFGAATGYVSSFVSSTFN